MTVRRPILDFEVVPGAAAAAKLPSRYQSLSYRLESLTFSRRRRRR